MTNPSSPSDPSASKDGLPAAGLPAAAPAPPVKAKRKGPRRATAPAGAPAVSSASSSSSASNQDGAAVLLVAADGTLLPSPTAGPSQEALSARPDAGDSGKPAGAPGAGDAASASAFASAEAAAAEGAAAAPVGGAAGAAAGAVGEDKAAALEGGATADKPRMQDGDKAAVSPADRPVATPTEDSPDKAVELPAPKDAAGQPPAPRGAAKVDSPRKDDKANTSNADPVPAADTGAAGAPEQEVAPTVELTPQSRRERRMAEQKSSAGVDHATPKAETAPALDVSPTVVPEQADPESNEEASQPQPRKQRGRIASFLRGLMAFLLISILVAALGTRLVGTDDSLAGPADTEVNRQAAWERAVALSADAMLLSDSAGTPELAEALRSAAEDLKVQAASLDDGLPDDSAEATDAATTAAPALPAAAAPTLDSLLDGLTGSGETLMNDAVTAERSMGRVFAAVGASQILQGQRLGALARSAPPKSPLLLAPRNFANPQGPQCSSTLAPRSGVTVDSALLAAAQSEQKAIYAYQVAATRLSNPQFTKATELLAGHERKLELLNAELSVRCLEEIDAVSGYSLDPGFTATPAASLAGLESELSTVYANLAAVSTPAPEPGEETGEGAAPTVSPTGSVANPVPTTTADVSVIQPANNGLLREMAVAWLLDSSAARLYWGGTVAPLAGISS